MLHVWKASGEELLALPVQGLSDVKQLKRDLQPRCGFSRFRQRLLHEGMPLNDDDRLEAPMDIQLVLVAYFAKR